MKLTIDLLDSTDENVLQLISCLQYGFTAAVEGELVSPDFETELRAWVRSERSRLRPQYARTPQRDTLRESQWFGFWSTLCADQEVRWTDAKAATYFCVTGDLVTDPPDARYRGSVGPYVELRRHTGKTFWTHVAKLRPLGWSS